MDLESWFLGCSNVCAAGRMPLGAYDAMPRPFSDTWIVNTNELQRHAEVMPVECHYQIFHLHYVQCIVSGAGARLGASAIRMP